MCREVYMKSKIYVISEDSLFLQHLYSLCSQWGVELVEVEKRKSLPKGTVEREKPVVLNDYRKSKMDYDEFKDNYDDEYENDDEYDYEDSKVMTIAQLEKQAIEAAIKECRGNITEVSRELKIGRATLYRKLKQYNINVALIRKKRVA